MQELEGILWFCRRWIMRSARCLRQSSMQVFSRGADSWRSRGRSSLLSVGETGLSVRSLICLRISSGSYIRAIIKDLGIRRKQFFTAMQDKFKVPDEQLRKLALGSLPGLPYRLKKSLELTLPLSQPIRKPKEGDWLWDHEEEGQTFDAYFSQMHNVVDAKRNVIYIKPLDSSIDIEFMKELKSYCECFFHPMKISILKQTNVLQGVDRRINEYTEKQQLNATQILRKLQKSLKPDAFCLIGVSLIDLYPRDEWNFVFGLASIRDRTGVFSFARYDPKFFTHAEYQINYRKIFWRAAGVMTHEIGHMFGMRHCIWHECLMNGSNNEEEASNKPIVLCPVCLRKLQSNIKFDILERYQKMLGWVRGKEDKPNKNLEQFLSVIVDKLEQQLK